MLLLTLIAREMRSAARQPFTYYLRILGVGVLLLVTTYMIIDGRGETGRGGQVFARLHSTLLTSIWVLVPLLTADCISRERREHTLSILFLTPLKPRQIVLAKGMAHGLRALTLWLAVLPVMAIPFVIGGVSWMEAILSVMLSFSSICLAMAAGLLASACSRVSMRALVWASCLAFLFFFGFASELGFLVAGGGMPLPFAFGKPVFELDPSLFFSFGSSLTLDVGACWQNLFGASLQPWLLRAGYVRPNAPLGTNLPLLINGAILGFSCLLGLALLIKLAAWNLSRVWREEPPSAQVTRIRKRFFTPLYFQPLFARWMRWELNHNPIGWLEQRTWSARLVTWSWFAVIMSIYSSLLSNLGLYQGAFHLIQTYLAWLLLISMAISASRSFHRERETGLLELLLVSPLRESQIIGGRVRGLLAQFMPAIALLMGLWIFFANFLAPGQDELTSVWYYAAVLLTLPVIGLYESLARNSSISAFLSTLLLGVAVPALVSQLGNLLEFARWAFGQPTVTFGSDNKTSLIAILFQILLAAAFFWRLHENLRCRRFALERPPA
jgi:ABC-type transport system involved in multi-copper enzyme maturation permease subunit